MYYIQNKSHFLVKEIEIGCKVIKVHLIFLIPFESTRQ